MDPDKDHKTMRSPFQPGVLEMQNQSHPQLRDAEIIQHFSPLMIGDAINHFRVRNHRAKNDEVWNEIADFHASKENRKPSLWSNVMLLSLNRTVNAFS